VQGQLEVAAAHVTLHLLVFMVFRLQVDGGRAVRAFALVLVLEVRVVVFSLGELGQGLGLGFGVDLCLARLTGASVRMPSRRFAQL